MIPEDEQQRDGGKLGPKFYKALAAYAAIALLAGFTLDGNFRLFVWVFLGVLAVRTYFHAVRKP